MILVDRIYTYKAHKTVHKMHNNESFVGTCNLLTYISEHTTYCSIITYGKEKFKEYKCSNSANVSQMLRQKTMNAVTTHHCH